MFIQWLLAALSIPAVLFLVIRSFENPDYIVGGLVAFVTLPWWGRFLVDVFDFIMEKTDNAFSLKMSRFIAFILFFFFIYLLYAIFYLLFL
jgi:hypothetical protein